MWRSVQRWRGVVIISTMAAITLWLAASGQLALYIHPRYNVFTVTMSIIAVVLAVLSVTGRRDHDDEDAPSTAALRACARAHGRRHCGGLCSRNGHRASCVAEHSDGRSKREVNATAGGDE